MRKFQEEVLRVDSDKRCLQTNAGCWKLPIGDCYFGVPESKSFGWTKLEQLPPKIEGFSFYLGSECEQLIDAFTQSEYPEHLVRLSIGDCSYGLGKGRNYEIITNILSQTKYPKLKVLELGVWELFSNSHCLFGSIGNVTKLLQNTPNLERLGLYGKFELDCPVTFSSLLDLTVTLDDYMTCINGGFISQSTLDNLLESSFPLLEEAFIDLECENNDKKYKISRNFLSGKDLPKLKKLEFAGGYMEGEIDFLMQSELYKKEGLIVFYSEPDH